MKYFCVSDIHGHYDVLVRDLEANGWDPNNIGHKLIVIGDMVDRGPQNKEVLEFLYDLYKDNKAIIIMGNHDVFLLDFLNGNFARTSFNFLHNGHDKTIEQLLGHKPDKLCKFEKDQTELLEKYPYLKDFLESLLPFYEVGKYIFVHGGVNSTLSDWRIDTMKNFTWNSQADMPTVPGKTVVCGHKQNVSLRAPNNYKEYLHYPDIFPDMFKTLYLKGSIHIDGSVVATKKLNVFILNI